MLFYMAPKNKQKTKKYIRTYAIIFLSLRKLVIFLRIYTPVAQGQTLLIGGSTAASSVISLFLPMYQREFEFLCWAIYEDSALDDLGLLE